MNRKTKTLKTREEHIEEVLSTSRKIYQISNLQSIKEIKQFKNKSDF